MADHRARASPLLTMDTRRFIARHVVDLPKSGIRDFFEIVAKMQDVISLGIGEPDFDTPWHIREAAIYALERGKTHYTSNLGLIELRRGLAHALSDVRVERGGHRARLAAGLQGADDEFAVQSDRGHL